MSTWLCMCVLACFTPRILTTCNFKAVMWYVKESEYSVNKSSEWHMLNPTVCVCLCVLKCGWTCMCINAKDPKGIRLSFWELPSRPSDPALHACLYLLSCSPHAEFNYAARTQYRRQIPWLGFPGYPWFTRVTLASKREEKRGTKRQRENEN